MADSDSRFVINKKEIEFVDVEELEREGTLKKYSTFDSENIKNKENGED